MTRKHRAGAFSILLLLAVWLAPPPGTAASKGAPSALDRYVYTPDRAYGYELVDTLDLGSITAHVLRMDSQRWRTQGEVDRTLWTHQLLIFVPDAPSHDTCLLLIEGGKNPVGEADPLFLGLGTALSLATSSVMAVVTQIPNQPLLFADQPSALIEDALVAYSWDKAMQTGDPVWTAYLPMTKAAVRAMDTVQDFLARLETPVPVEDFVVTGFSKRGAAAWLTAAVDDRVRAVAPGVFDILKVALQIERHWEAYGFYSFAIDDYLDYDVIRRVRSPEGRFLQTVVDPFSYRAQLDMPKLLLISTGDQFFLPDASHFYLDELPGETLVRQIPNTDHAFRSGELKMVASLISWYQTIVGPAERPSVSWRRTLFGGLEVTSTPPASSAKLWRATNPDSRDFRLDTTGPAWQSTRLTPSAAGSWRVNVSAPASGFTGYLVELTFEGSEGAGRQIYGTPVFMTPSELPFELEDPIGEPRSARYWECQLPGPPADCREPLDYSAAQLQELLPFSVFGDYVTNVDELRDSLEPVWPLAPLARRQCTAARLNLAAQEYGWYSPLAWARDAKPFWQIYQLADTGEPVKRPLLAAVVCARLNGPQP